MTTGLSAWPVATIEALGIAYFERYYNESTDSYTFGFYSPDISGLPQLNNDNNNQIVASGYCAIVPRVGGYSIRLSTLATQNRHLPSQSFNGTNFVIIPADMISQINTSTVIYVNDRPVGDYINTQFAKAIYSAPAANPDQLYVRTPLQMFNISYATQVNSSGNPTIFTQERDLDFTGFELLRLSPTEAVVYTPFGGEFDGGGNIIRGVTIAYTQPYNATSASSVGLFSQITGSGIVRNVTLEFDGAALVPPSITGYDNPAVSYGMYVGAIAGQNAGTISDVAIVSSLFESTGTTATAISPVGGTGSVGGVVGNNTGSLIRIIYLAVAPGDGSNIYPIVNTNTAPSTATIRDLFYLGGAVTAAIVSADGSVLNPVAGFNYILSDNGVGTRVNTDTLVSSVVASDLLTIPGGWTNPTPPPP